MKIRVHPQEKKYYKNFAKQLGITMSKLFRMSVLEGPPAKNQRADPELVRQVAGIANNVNQIARQKNYREKVGEPIDVVQMNVLLRQILEEAKKCLPK